MLINEGPCFEVSFEVDDDLTPFLMRQRMIPSTMLVTNNDIATTKNVPAIIVNTIPSTDICEK